MARTVLLGSLVMVFGAIATFAAPDAQPDIVGVYRCSGVNPDGSQYEGVAEIAKVDGTYRILWTLSDRSSVLGVGIFSGGVFAVSYFGGAPAVAVYRPDGDRLIGEWTMGGKEGAVYTETLTKVAADRRPQAVPRPRQGPTPTPEKPQPSGRGIRL